MAVPTNAVINRTAPLKSGVMLGISPSSDPTFDVEVERATSSGVYSTVARLVPKGSGMPVVFEDLLPVDGKARSYKARAVKDGYQAGTYTATLTVKPVYLPEIAPNVTPLTGQQIGSPLFLSSGKPPQYGKANLQQYYQGQMGAKMFEFTSTSSAVTYARDALILYPLSTAARRFYWRWRGPEDVRNVTASFSYHRASTKGSFRIRFGHESPALSWYFDYTATGIAGTYTKAISSGFTITAGFEPYCRVDITTTAGSTASIVFIGLDFTYYKPTVSVAV